MTERVRALSAAFPSLWMRGLQLVDSWSSRPGEPLAGLPKCFEGAGQKEVSCAGLRGRVLGRWCRLMHGWYGHDAGPSGGGLLVFSGTQAPPLFPALPRSPLYNLVQFMGDVGKICRFLITCRFTLSLLYDPNLLSLSPVRILLDSEVVKKSIRTVDQSHLTLQNK